MVLLEGDLYTSHGLFPELFQTTIPWEWQAHVIARYVVVDRKARDVVFLGEGPEARTASRALAAALTYWGGSLAASFDDRSGDPVTGQTAALKRAAKADWAVVFGPPVGSLDLVNAIEEQAGINRSAHPGARPGITGSAALLVSGGGLAKPEPGTSACCTVISGSSCSGSFTSPTTGLNAGCGADCAECTPVEFCERSQT